MKEWEAPGAEWDQLCCWHSAILGELEGRLCQSSPTYNHWSTTCDMPQSLFEIVSLQTSITLRNLRTCLLPCSPSKGLPRFPVHVCARGKILAPIPKTFENCETIAFDNISNMWDILFEHFWSLHHLPANQGTACLQVGFAAHNHYLDEESLFRRQALSQLK